MMEKRKRVSVGDFVEILELSQNTDEAVQSLGCKPASFKLRLNRLLKDPVYGPVIQTIDTGKFKSQKNRQSSLEDVKAKLALARGVSLSELEQTIAGGE